MLDKDDAPKQWTTVNGKSSPQKRFYSKRKNRITPILYIGNDGGE